jgi:hypothetical protein
MTKWTYNELVEALRDGYQVRKDNYNLTYRLVDNRGGYDIDVAYLTFKQFIKLDLVEVEYTTLYTYYKLKEVNA